MPTSKIQTGLRISETTHEKLSIISKKELRSINNLVEYAVEKYVADYEKEHGVIQVDSPQ